MPLFSNGRALWILIMLGLAACTRQPEPPAFPNEVLATPVPQEALPTIAELLDDDQFLFFQSLLRSAGADIEVEAASLMTVLAPTNDAFSQIGWTPSQTDPDVLRQVMRHHLIGEELSTADLLVTGLVQSEIGGFISFTSRGNVVRADFASVTRADMRAANGIVHVIDAVLIPPERGEVVSIWGQLRNDSRLTTVRGLVEEAGLAYQLRFGDVDGLLAPTDLAFRELSGEQQAWLADAEHRLDLLNYLLLNEPGWPAGQPILLDDLRELVEVGSQLNFRFGFNPWERIQVSRDAETLYLDGAAVVDGDRLATNGVVHVLNRVIIPRPAP